MADVRIYACISSGDLQAAEDLCAETDGAALNTTNCFGRTPLHYAARNGSTDLVLLFFRYGADVNARNINGWTPLHEACRFGHIDTVEVLLSVCNVDVNAITKYGSSCLHFAARYGNSELTKILLEFGATAEFRNSSGQTAILRALALGNEEVFLELAKWIERRRICRMRDRNGCSVLHYMANENMFEAAGWLWKMDNGSTFLQLSSARDIGGNMPIHYSAAKGHVEISRILLDNSHYSDPQNTNGYTPLHLACRDSRTDMVLLLIRKGGSVRTKDNRGREPLSLCANVECRKIVSCFLSAAKEALKPHSERRDSN